MNPPSQEALKLAKLLQPVWGVEETASVIDRELQLPARNAALLLAQQVCDARQRRANTLGPVNELRDALAKIHK